MRLIALPASGLLQDADRTSSSKMRREVAAFMAFIASTP